MSKPQWAGTCEGQWVQDFDKPGYWIWHFKPVEKPLLKLLSLATPPEGYMNAQPVTSEIATGLTRKEAGKLAKVLLLSPTCCGVMIEPLPVPGEWTFTPREESDDESGQRVSDFVGEDVHSA